jgi:hypothetical protein
MMKVIRRIIGVIMLAALPVTAFTQIDTSGIGTWSPMYNSLENWEDGAFSAYASGDFDVGWGIYNMLTHYVTGDSLFVIKLQDGSYRELWIVNLDANQHYTFRYARLDGSDPHEVTIGTNDYISKQFVMYSLANNAVMDQQPDKSDWDMLLTKFWDPDMEYVVTGFLANDGVSVSVFHAADSATAAEATLADATEFTDSIGAIGNSWYRLQMEPYPAIVPIDTVAYFVKTEAEDTFKLQVTYFESGVSGLGKVGIRKQLLSGTPDPGFVYDTLVMGSNYANEVFFGMGSTDKVEVPRNTWDIGFRTGPFTSSIITNTTMGVELYTYPYGDTTAWEYPTAVINTGVRDAGINVYPVPAGNEVFIHHDFNTPGDFGIRLYDVSGRLVREFHVNPDGRSDIRLDLSGIRAGVYLIRMEGTGIRAVSKISIQ